MAAEATIEGELAALDALELGMVRPRSRAGRLWSAAWPKLSAVALVLAAWQLLVLSGWRPDYLLPGPGPVLARLGQDLGDPSFWTAVGVTLQRALTGYALALCLGVLLGAAVARNRVLRAAIGSMITGLQSMPSIAWFPLAILLFGLTEGAIVFVVLLGAAPAIANGLISGIDQIPPLLVRCGRSMGAGRLALYRHVVLPASLPAFLGGLKQGWAFAWRSLMAGELIVIVANRPSIGAQLQLARDFSRAQEMMALMLVILVIGILVDSVFGRADRTIRRRWGLIENVS
jgi:NitT/TauT family transport system permease protein